MQHGWEEIGGMRPATRTTLLLQDFRCIGEVSDVAEAKNGLSVCLSDRICQVRGECQNQKRDGERSK